MPKRMPQFFMTSIVSMMPLILFAFNNNNVDNFIEKIRANRFLSTNHTQDQKRLIIVVNDAKLNCKTVDATAIAKSYNNLANIAHRTFAGDIFVFVKVFDRGACVQ